MIMVIHFFKFHKNSNSAYVARHPLMCTVYTNRKVYASLSSSDVYFVCSEEDISYENDNDDGDRK